MLVMLQFICEPVAICCYGFYLIQGYLLRTSFAFRLIFGLLFHLVHMILCELQNLLSRVEYCILHERNDFKGSHHVLVLCKCRDGNVNSEPET